MNGVFSNAEIFKKILATLLLLLFVFSPFLLSCEDSEPQPNNRVIYGYFDTVCVFYDYTGMPTEDFNLLSRSVEAAIAHYHRLFDIRGEYAGVTNLATVNRMAGQGKVAVSKEIIDFLIFSREMYSLTGGKVNIAMGSVISLWPTYKTPADERKIPTAEQLSEAAKHISFDNVVIDEEGSTVEITDPNTRLDVGAIAKGYTAELIKRELAAEGYSGLVLDFGGNLCAVGEKPSGEGWKSGIENPLYKKGEGEPYVRTVTLKNDSLVTSGTYIRNYEVDGKIYHHIIDPVTLAPENRYLSLTVQTAHSGIADALSTAIFNMDLSEAEAFVSELEGVEVTLVFNDGSHKVLP